MCLKITEQTNCHLAVSEKKKEEEEEAGGGASLLPFFRNITCHISWLDHQVT